jgi:hypothetical protein
MKIIESNHRLIISAGGYASNSKTCQSRNLFNGVSVHRRSDFGGCILTLVEKRTCPFAEDVSYSPPPGKTMIV